MKIHLYSICWNEEKIVPFFLRHYGPIVDRIFIGDDNSTDRTAEILRENSLVTFQGFENSGDSFELAKQAHVNSVWKQSKGEADWVIFCDMDEFLYHPNLRLYLEQAAEKGITVIPSKGFHMIADAFPEEIGDLPKMITRGAPEDMMSKTLIFNPNAIQEINFSVGQHTANPIGRVIYPDTSEIKLLHYKYLGKEYLARRHAMLYTRLRKVDLEKRYSKHYHFSEAEFLADFEKRKQQSVEVVAEDPFHIMVTGQSFRMLQKYRVELDERRIENIKILDVLRSVERRISSIDKLFATYCEKTKNPFKLLLSRMSAPGTMREERKTIEAELKAIGTELEKIRKNRKKTTEESVE